MNITLLIVENQLRINTISHLFTILSKLFKFVQVKQMRNAFDLNQFLQCTLL